MLVGGRLRRADAGRGLPVHDAAGTVVAFATTASRTDLTDAVVAARAALPGWSALPPQERGRLMFDVAAALDERPAPDTGVPVDEAGAAADRWLWYAGWADKLADLAGAVHPAAGPYASWSTPRPVGVVGALVPGSLRELVDGVAPVLVAGATAVVVTPHDRPWAAATLAGVLATAELPPGAANLLTGDLAALAPDLARADVDGLDLAGAPSDSATDQARAAAARGVRVLAAAPADAGLARLRAWST